MNRRRFLGGLALTATALSTWWVLATALRRPGQGALAHGSALPCQPLEDLASPQLRRVLFQAPRAGLLVVRPDCPHCQRQLALLERALEEGVRSHLVLIVLGSPQTPRGLEQHRRTSFPTLFDPHREVARSLGVRTVPTLFLLRRGKVTARQRGEVVWQAVAHLAGEPEGDAGLGPKAETGGGSP